jgi:hypothetical protein
MQQLTYKAQLSQKRLLEQGFVALVCIGPLLYIGPLVRGGGVYLLRQTGTCISQWGILSIRCVHANWLYNCNLLHACNPADGHVPTQT